MELFVSALVTYLVVIDPPGCVPIFASLTEGAPEAHRRQMAIRSVIVAAGILLFFALAIVITSVTLYRFTRCIRSTLLVVVCSLVAVVWQLGLLPLLGYELDPYSVLVPFLIFAIGMSHGAQKMNGIMQDIGRGIHRVVAARFTFRRLFMAGLMALLCDAVGFAVLMIIKIDLNRY